MWNVAILALIPGVALAGHGTAPVRVAAAAVADNSAPASTVVRSGRPTKEGDGPSQGLLRMTISATTERIPLPRTRSPIVLSTDALVRRIRLTPGKGDSAALLLARVLKHAGFLCPQVALKYGVVELTCRSARIETQLTHERNETYLDINELRGLPWRPGPDAPPAYHYDPWRVGLGQSCPGKSPAARGECELKGGHLLEAAGHFRQALDTTARQMACVRLGDLAIATGDPITAAGWYRRAGSFGMFGRVADARLCELDGRCLTTTQQVLRAFDTTGMPEPLRAETTIRAARAEAYAGRLPSAAQVIARQVKAHGAASVCREDGELLCRRILIAAMRAADAAVNPRWLASGGTGGSGGSEGKSGTPKKPPLEGPEREYLEQLVETYLALVGWDKGPMAVDLAQAAAPLASRLGAPAFGGNLLAAMAPQVPDAQLSDHLLLAAETFLDGDNWARARIVVEYAQSRLPPSELKRTRRSGAAGSSDGSGKSAAGSSASAASAGALQGARWNAVFQALAAAAAQDEVSPAQQAAIDVEFRSTVNELKRARELAERARSVLNGTRDARGQSPGSGGGSAGAGDSSAAAPGTRSTRSPSGGAERGPSAATTKPDRSSDGSAALAKNFDQNVEKNAEAPR
ncbi:MAG: hypothetical protein ABIW57_10735 [Polyangia bacterium]